MQHSTIRTHLEVLNTMSLVVRSKVKEHVQDLNVSSDFAEALNKQVEHLIGEACRRAKENGRRTVQARDL